MKVSRHKNGNNEENGIEKEIFRRVILSALCTYNFNLENVENCTINSIHWNF